MRPSALLAFRGLAARIHPQIGLTARESSRLLNSLKASFRDQLDQAYPYNDNKAKDKAKHVTAPQPQSHDPYRLPVAADDHLSSILNDPSLLGAQYNGNTDFWKLFRDALDTEHPLTVLDRYNVNAAALPGVVRLCLASFLDSLSAMSPESARAKVISQTAGSRALPCLLTQGGTLRLSCGPDRIIGQVASLLAIEGKDTQLWEALSRTIATRASFDFGIVRFAVNGLVSSHLSARGGRNAELALTTYMRAIRAVPPEKHTETLSSSNRLLLARLTSLDDPALSKRYASLYSQFVTAFKRIETDKDRLITGVAALALHHPVEPRPAAALRVLRTWDKYDPRTTSRFIHQIARLVTLLESHGLHDDAAWVIDFARQRATDRTDDGTLPAPTASTSIRSAQQTNDFATRDWEWKSLLPT